MIRRAALLLCLGLALTGCKLDKKGTLVISEACEVAWKILYARDGRFTFTDDEIDHLRPINVDKLSDLKRWFKQECPEQYARTVGGRKAKP